MDLNKKIICVLIILALAGILVNTSLIFVFYNSDDSQVNPEKNFAINNENKQVSEKTLSQSYDIPYEISSQKGSLAELDEEPPKINEYSNYDSILIPEVENSVFSDKPPMNSTDNEEMPPQTSEQEQVNSNTQENEPF